jgi:hypothetical protein
MGMGLGKCSALTVLLDSDGWPSGPSLAQSPADPMGPCRRSAVRPHHARRLRPVQSS